MNSRLLPNSGNAYMSLASMATRLLVFYQLHNHISPYVGLVHERRHAGWIFLPIRL